MSEALSTTTYDEACAHVARQHAATDGLVVGGTFRIEFGEGRVAEIELRMTKNGVVRPV